MKIGKEESRRRERRGAQGVRRTMPLPGTHIAPRVSVMRRLVRAVAPAFCVALGALMYSSAPAMASRTHVFDGSLGGPCTGSAGACEPGELSEPTGVAVNDSTGDVYVVASPENRVEQFSSTGTYLSSFNGSAAPTGALVRPTGVAIDNSTNPLDPSAGDVYVIDGGLNVIYKFSSSGIYEGQLSEAESGAPFSRLDGVAVATSGTVWAYQATGEIDEFSDALNNGFVSSRVSQAPGSPNPGLAVDSEGNLYVVSREARVVSKLNEQGEVLKEEIADEEAVSGIA